MKVYMENQDGTRFWACEVIDNRAETTFGSVGNAGRTTTKYFATDEEAEAYVVTRSGAKRQNGGYHDAVATKNSNNSAATPMPTPSAVLSASSPVVPSAVGSASAVVPAPVVSAAPVVPAPVLSAPPAATKAAAAAASPPAAAAAAVAPPAAAAAAAPAIGTPSQQKDLRGFAPPNFNNTVVWMDSGVAGIDAALASYLELHDTHHARLGLVDPIQDWNEYYIIQLLVDHSKTQYQPPPKRARRGNNNNNNNNRNNNNNNGQGAYYLYTRWGDTGESGQARIDGPYSDEDDCKETFENVFKAKTGDSWGQAVPGKPARPGKFEYLAVTTHRNNRNNNRNNNNNNIQNQNNHIQNPYNNNRNNNRNNNNNNNNRNNNNNIHNPYQQRQQPPNRYNHYSDSEYDSHSESEDEQSDDEDEEEVAWYYYLDNDPLGKADGWYKYDNDNRNEAENLYQIYATGNYAPWLAQRIINNDTTGFRYSIDFNLMTQTNLSSGKSRPIGRTDNGRPPTYVP